MPFQVNGNKTRGEELAHAISKTNDQLILIIPHSIWLLNGDGKHYSYTSSHVSRSWERRGRDQKRSVIVPENMISHPAEEDLPQRGIDLFLGQVT